LDEQTFGMLDAVENEAVVPSSWPVCWSAYGADDFLEIMLHDLQASVLAGGLPREIGIKPKIVAGDVTSPSE
jgi:hypothetical protein